MKILANELLSKYTTFHLGGEARYFCEVKNIEELEEALKFAKEKKMPYFILGGGSNVSADDSGYNGLIIRMMNCKFRIMDEYDKEYDKYDEYKYIEAEAGVSLAKVVSECEKNNLMGMEWAWGIPGTVGGAVRGNAGAYGGEMKDGVESAKVLRAGKIKELKNKDCRFGYRNSIFKKNKDIILSVRVKINKTDGTNRTNDVAAQKEGRANGSPLREKIKCERREKFAVGFSAGSFFKNVLLSEKKIGEFKNRFPELPDGFINNKKISVAWLIDQCELKGFCVGDICVSKKHAGILINRGKGTSENLNILVGIIKMKVRDKFGINIEEEVQHLR